MVLARKAHISECFGYHLIISIHRIAKETVTCVNTQLNAYFFSKITKQEKFRKTKKHFLLSNDIPVF